MWAYLPCPVLLLHYAKLKYAERNLADLAYFTKLQSIACCFNYFQASLHVLAKFFKGNQNASRTAIFSPLDVKHGTGIQTERKVLSHFDQSTANQLIYKFLS